MQKSLLILAVCGIWGASHAMAASSICDAVAGNLVLNCGFETGDFTDWNLTGSTDNPGNNYYGVDAFDANSGSYGAFMSQDFLDEGATSVDLGQTLPTTAGGEYQITFYLEQDTAPTLGYNHAFTASWGGSTIESLTPTVAVPGTVGSFVEYSFIETTPTASTALEFTFENDDEYWSFDDASVTPVPEPSTALLGGLALGALWLVGRRKRARFYGSAGLIALFVFAAGGVKASPQTPDAVNAGAGSRIKGAISEDKLVKLGRNTRPDANAANDRGAVADDFPVEHVLLILQRSPEREQALDKLIDQLNDKTSPNFHRWLTAEQYGKQYGVAPADIDAVTNWLGSHGFQVNRVYPNQIVIDFSGTAREVREAFHTELHQIQSGGKLHIANMSDPAIPAALAPVIRGLNSLNDFKPHPMIKKVKPPLEPLYTASGCTTTADFPTEPGTCYFVTPADEQAIYNLTPLYPAAGKPDGSGKVSGQGVNVAVVEDTDTYSGAGDWNYFRKVFGLARTYPYATYTQLHPGCTDPGTNGDDGEAAIDVEEVTGFAPNANVYLIACPSTTFTFGGQLALQNLINEAPSGPYNAPGGIGIVSVSYGVCEAASGAGGNASFYNTYQQAASEGVTVFVSSGDELSSSCGNEFSATGADYPYWSVASLSVSGWASTPYNVAVGGTDYEDVYNAKFFSIPLSTYWNPTNTANYGSALSYIPEIPWNDSCASVLIANYSFASYNTYGVSGTGFCNTAPYNSTSASYLDASMIGASGGPSNCAIGSAGLDQTDYLITTAYCQGYAKPSWQSVYGNPADGVRDLPDISLFAANGAWGHAGIFCWSDPAFTADGAATCAGNAPSKWSGFGGTSLAAPSMAGVQALVNEKTGELWGNANTIYYQIGQAEYGTAGGSFGGSACNSSGSGGPASGCAFNDVTQGDIDGACRRNGTTLENHCYKPSTNGVLSTDAVSGAAVINGGSGYTSAPTCTIAQPSNLAPYISPSGTTLWAGGTQATCSAAINAGSTTAKYTLTIEAAAAAGQMITVGSQNFTLAGATTTAIATALAASINGGSTVATATSSGANVTVTAKTAGYAGNFNLIWATGFLFGESYVEIVDTTLGQGPGYVSGITVTAAGTGYGPDTPITLTGGAGSGAIAVANTTPGTAAGTYQPAFGAAKGWDMATGLGTPNAYNLVMNPAWSSVSAARPK
jgi:Pro-kumamolisin, activation domain